MSNKLSDTRELKKLGSATTYEYDGANASLLERFPNPLTRGPGVGHLNITAPEFTSLCPMTGQPDFATIVVEYVPRNWCVESKAWKLYLGSYRQVGEFHESCVRRITNDLIALLDPWQLTVRGEFTPRGGIPFWPEINYERPQLVLDFEDLDDDDDLPEEVVASALERTHEVLLTSGDRVVGYAYKTGQQDEPVLVDYRRPINLGDATQIQH